MTDLVVRDGRIEAVFALTGDEPDPARGVAKAGPLLTALSTKRGHSPHGQRPGAAQSRKADVEPDPERCVAEATSLLTALSAKLAEEWLP